MKLDIRLKDGATKEVRARRILVNDFPKLELYIHKSPIENEKGEIDFREMIWSVSTKEGIAITSGGYGYLRRTVSFVRETIYMCGQEKVLKRQQEVLKKVIS